jgi:SSS family solute:Na+ symporter
MTIYTGVVALALNIVVAVVLTIVFRAMSLPEGVDTTKEEDYHVESGDPGVSAAPATEVQAADVQSAARSSGR